MIYCCIYLNAYYFWQVKVYNPKEWFKAVFYFHRSDSLRKLFPYLILSALLSWAIAYVELEYLKLSDKSWLRNITLVHNLLGFAISLLIVFRTNTAYDRWWEARRQWGGLTNVSRNLAIKLNNFLLQEDGAMRNFFRQNISLFAQSLFSHLRSDYTTYMLDQADHPEFNFTEGHGPSQVINSMYRHVHSLYREEKLSGEQLMILNADLQEMINICGACERIKNTPIPYSYSSFIKKFVVLYVLTLPIGFVFSMGYFVIVAVPFILYVLATLELIAESIENPFGVEADDLPIDKITDNIQRSVDEILAA